MSELFFGIDRSVAPDTLAGWKPTRRPTEAEIRATVEHIRTVPLRRVHYIHPDEWQYFRDLGLIGPNGEIW